MDVLLLFSAIIMVSIRRFKHGDIFTVMRLVSDTFQEDYDPSVLIDFFNSWQDGFLIVEEANEIIGILVGSLPAPNQARILIFGIEKRWQRRGVGTMLLNYFIQQCTLRNVKLITLEVRINNYGAMEFYKKFNFTIVNTIPHYYKDGMDGYVMHKVL